MIAAARVERIDPDASADASQSARVARLFREHCGLVERALRRSGVCEADLADARQEVFIVVHRRLAQFEARSSVTTWLYGIAYHVACDFRRRAARARARDAELGDEAPAGHDDGTTIEERDALLCALRAIEALAPEQRTVFVLHELCELPMREVALRVGCPLKTAFSRLYAARRVLLPRLRDSGVLALLPPWRWIAPPSPLARIVHAAGRLQTPKTLATLASVAALCLLGPLPRAVEPESARERASAAHDLPALALRTRSETHGAPLAGSISRTAEPAVRRVPRRAAARSVTIADATPAPSPPPIGDDFEIIHAGAIDLRPRVENPLGPELEEPAPPARIRLRGPARAVDGVERELVLGSN